MKCSWASVGSISSLGDFDTHQTGASQVALEVKNPPASALDITMRVGSLGQEEPLEEKMTTHSSILA